MHYNMCLLFHTPLVPHLPLLLPPQCCHVQHDPVHILHVVDRKWRKTKDKDVGNRREVSLMAYVWDVCDGMFSLPFLPN